MGLRLEKRANGDWGVVGRVNGRALRRTMGTNIKELAEQKRIELEWNIAKGAVPTTKAVTFAEAAKDYEATAGRRLSKGQVYGLGRAVAYLGSRNVRDMGPRDVGEFLNADLPGRSDATRRRFGSIVVTVLNYAHDCGLRGPVRVTLPPDSEGRLRWLTEEEEVRFLAKTPEIYWPFFAFMLSTGARAGELVALDWSDIDGASETVALRSKKGRNGRVKLRRVPLNKLAMKALDEQARLMRAGRKRQGPVFVNGLGDRWAGVRSLELVVGKVSEAAGLEDLVLHDLRHTFASRLVQKGVALQVVSELLGHSGMAQTLRYAHLAPGESRAAVEVLAREVLKAFE
jgi:integrase